MPICTFPVWRNPFRWDCISWRYTCSSRASPRSWSLNRTRKWIWARPFSLSGQILHEGHVQCRLFLLPRLLSMRHQLYSPVFSLSKGHRWSNPWNGAHADPSMGSRLCHPASSCPLPDLCSGRPQRTEAPDIFRNVFLRYFINPRFLTSMR